MKFEGDRTTRAQGQPSDAVYSLTAAVAWGLMFPVAAGIVDRIDAFNLTGLRYLGASAIFLALLWVVEGRRAISYEGRFLHLWWLGTLGFAGFNLLAFLALEFTEPQNAALIVATAPLVTVLVRWGRDGIRPPRVVTALIVVALVGVSTVLGKGDPTVLVTGGFNIGDALVLGGVISFVFYTLGASDYSHMSPLRYTALTAPAGLLTILGVTAVADLAGWRTLPSGGDVGAEWLGIVYVIVAGGVIGVLAWNQGVRKLGPPVAALFMNLVPVTAFAVQIARGYEPAAGELVGAVVTIGAIVAANRVSHRATRPAAPRLQEAPAPPEAPALAVVGSRVPAVDELPSLWPANAPTVREAFAARPARTVMLPMGSTIQRRR